MVVIIMQKTRCYQVLTLLLGCCVLSITPLSSGFFPSVQKPFHSTDLLLIHLDCGNISGVIHAFGQINDGPLPIVNSSSYADLTEQYRKIGITAIRTHDLYGPTDVTTIFPDWDADPTSESSYHFETSDRYITSIIHAGCQVFYRLGESASDNHTLRQPPTNFSKWADVCRHIVMHYNGGWNNGYFYNITYWEVWNEPDLSGFWNGTAAQYYQLYHLTADALKSYNPSLKIGGPCTSSVSNVNYTEGFLHYVSEHDIPLDFFSWHRYASTPFEFYKDSCHCQMLLDSYGFTDTENINTEWNLDILTPQRDKDNAKNAAFTACSFTVFQDAGVDQAFRYRGNQEKNWLMRFLGLDLSLFSYTGIYKRPALVYQMMKTMVTETPLRISTPHMNGSTGVTYLAGISEDKTNISIMISNFDTERVEYGLELTNLPWTTNFTNSQYLIDETHHFEVINETVNSILYSNSHSLASNSIHFFRFTNSSVLPTEGPEVAAIPLLLRLPLLDPFTRLLAILLVLFIFQ
jgi:xylan 1,4-beta-xylosidase